jgi:hypothetical protein
MIPIAVLLMPLASVYMARETVNMLSFAVLYLGSALVTVFVLWTLGKSLCVRAKPSESQVPQEAAETLAPAPLHADGAGKNQIVINITEQDYLRAQWLHHNLNAWRIGGVIVLVSLIAAFAHVAANVSVSVSAGGAIGYMAWYLLSYFVILRSRCEKLYGQQRTLHIPTEVVWSNETIEFINANSSSVLKWSDYVRHKENDKLFLLYQSDALFNMIPKSAFVSPEHLKDFSSNLDRDR